MSHDADGKSGGPNTPEAVVARQIRMQRLQHLLSELIDGSLSVPELAELDRFLKTENEACDAAVDFLVLDELLKETRGQESLTTLVDLISDGISNDRGRSGRPLNHRRRSFVERLSTRFVWTACSLVLFLTTVTAFAWIPAKRVVVGRILQVAGATQLLGAEGTTISSVDVTTAIGAGDSIETRSCDALVEFDLEGDTTLVLAGKSSLRVLNSEPGSKRFELSYGTLWIQSNSNQIKGKRKSVRPLTNELVLSTSRIQFDDAKFNVQTSDSESIVRVNFGSARVTSLTDHQSVDVRSGHQVYISLSNKHDLRVVPQPMPTDSWRCDLRSSPVVLLGNWLPPTEHAPIRLGAAPLLWPLPGRDPVMLYAVAMAAWRSSPQPVQLRAASHFRFRGRTEKSHPVRFGFSTQKRHGVFAGKFEIDVAPDQFGSVGQIWDVELSLDQFRALHPHLASTPEGLELTDVYALTVEKDAGLEITDIELHKPSKPVVNDQPGHDEIAKWTSGQQSIQVAGIDRTFLLDIPRQIQPDAALVMVFHGYSDSAEGVRSASGFSKLADQYGFVVAYPQGTKDSNGNSFFNVGYSFHADNKIDDIRFVREISDRLIHDLKLDPKKVFATGMSNGGDMSYFLASQTRPFVRAIAPVAGTMMSSWGERFKPSQRISVLHVHGTADDVTRWNGDLENRDGWGAYYGVEEVLRKWTEGMNLETSSVRKWGDRIQLQQWTTSKDQTEVRLFKIVDGGHDWPEFLGDTNQTTAAVIWDFFKEHAKD